MIYFTKEDDRVLLTAAGERALGMLGLTAEALRHLDESGVREVLSTQLEIGTRIPYQGEAPNVGGRANHGRGDGYGFQPQGDAVSPNTSGRFPANLLCSDDILSDGQKHSQGHWAKTKVTGFGEFGGGKAEYHGTGPKDKVTTFSRYFSLDAWMDRKQQDLPPLPSVPDPRRLSLAMYLLTMGSKPGDTILALNCDMAKVAAEVMGRDYLAVKRHEDLDPAGDNMEVAI